MAEATATDEEIEKFIALFQANKVPLYAVLPSLTWVLHDYFITIEDEIRYIWPQRRSLGKFLYLWIRYYTIVLLLFDVIQIHLFARPGITSNIVCVAMDPVTRVAGAISLWSVEIIMQIRIYALFKCSRKVAIFNLMLFAVSIGTFLWILVYNTRLRSSLISTAVKLPLPGCPIINGGKMQWALWIPATGYEITLFGFALYQAITTAWMRQFRSKISLQALLVHDNILYFFAVAGLLVFNNLMVVGKTKIPWFSFGPFHAAIGIMTGRMLLHLRKASLTSQVSSTSSDESSSDNAVGIQWARDHDSEDHVIDVSPLRGVPMNSLTTVSLAKP